MKSFLSDCFYYMHPILRNILGIILGIFIGGLVNGYIIKYGPQIFPLPDGVTVLNEDTLKNHIHLFKPQHFLTPWLAHALGTFIGSLVTAIFTRKLISTLIIGLIFFIGGLIMVNMLHPPIWFNILDLMLAYFPMSYLAYLLVPRKIIYNERI